MKLLTLIKADLIEKRLWLVIAALFALMVAAVVLVGGGSSSGGAVPPGGASGAGPLGPAITASAVNPNLAVAETTTGARFQRQGGAHDPFFALVGPKVATTQTGTTGSGSAPRASTPGTGTGTGTGSGTAPTTPPPTTVPTPSLPTPTPTSPVPVTPPKAVYNVDFLFGQVPSNTTDPPTPSQLNAMPDVNNPTIGTPLPDSTVALLAYTGVRPSGQALTLTVKKEAIPQGEGVCRPDPSNCQFIDVKPGQYETFDYEQPGGALVRYAIEVKSINKA